jgi:hypothetical protein
MVSKRPADHQKCMPSMLCSSSVTSISSSLSNAPRWHLIVQPAFFYIILFWQKSAVLAMSDGKMRKGIKVEEEMLSDQGEEEKASAGRDRYRSVRLASDACANSSSNCSSDHGAVLPAAVTPCLQLDALPTLLKCENMPRNQRKCSVSRRHGEEADAVGTAKGDDAPIDKVKRKRRSRSASSSSSHTSSSSSSSFSSSPPFSGCSSKREYLQVLAYFDYYLGRMMPIVSFFNHRRFIVSLDELSLSCHLICTALCLHAKRLSEPRRDFPPCSFMQLQFPPLQLQRFLRGFVLATAHRLVTPPASVFRLVHARTKSRWMDRIFVRVMSGFVRKAEVRWQGACCACLSFSSAHMG